MTARYSFGFDEPTRSLRVLSHGTWTLEQAERYKQAFCSHLSVARERFGCARVLVDGRAAATNDVAVSRLLGSLGTLFNQLGDRLAIVTPSSLRKQQAVREGLPDTIMVFLSPDAAKTWLFAHD
ncbi:hypothetical protein [Sphingomonas gellani]|uniref:hypothetical protein n=1 Tax=Sphingomonas gellani TaxID=1166340 RepID=UPI001BB08CF2|nr:hypothetical protein [Sphingomonas gellani]